MDQPDPLDPGVPRSVLSWIDDNGGVHNDCLIASDPCKACREQLMAALEAVYANATSEEDVIASLMADFAKDHIEDERRSRE